jgi:tetratricopeptide (TPR) repeat protein
MKFKSAFAAFSIISLFIVVFLAAISSPLEAQSLSARKKATALADSMQSVQTTQPVQEIQLVQAKVQSDQTVAAGAAKPTPKSTSDKNADYWFEKGALCATYGNDRAAVKYFQKAISLDPNRSNAYFEQGVSYGQLGEFDKGLALIDKALEMQPQNGMYLYGRGRLYLLSGDKEKAMQDFNKAAELDNEDARSYLEYLARNEE